MLSSLADLELEIDSNCLCRFDSSCFSPWVSIGYVPIDSRCWMSLVSSLLVLVDSSCFVHWSLVVPDWFP